MSGHVVYLWSSTAEWPTHGVNCLREDNTEDTLMITVSLSLSSPAASCLINAGRTFNVRLFTERMSEVWVIKWRTRQTRNTEPGSSAHLWLLIASSNCSYIKTWSQHVWTFLFFVSGLEMSYHKVVPVFLLKIIQICNRNILFQELYF